MQDSGTRRLAAAATWADFVLTRIWTDGIQVGRVGADSSVIAALCAQVRSCITAALDAQIKILKDTHADAKDRAAAVRYIIHFAGDIHQPLHCTSNGDRGGNCVPVTYFKIKPKPNTGTTNDPDDYSPNLHGIWDTQILEKV
jgi:hypothetical protein